MTHAGQDPVYAGALLGYAKASVRNTAAAITETATPQVRRMLMAHLRKTIRLHAKVFHYMYRRGLYPVHHPDQIIQNDFRSAKMALAMPVMTSHHTMKHKPMPMPVHPPLGGMWAKTGPSVSTGGTHGWATPAKSHPAYACSTQLSHLETESPPSDVPYPYHLESGDDESHDDIPGGHRDLRKETDADA
ncbi:spore coat protein [Alicyclobacillus kakegawensis]|uniref:spore coat protein n=1 Tax=Alicyclobacillus kakegawensis TaxID=392012 RepID=UPI0008349556|nr:spore coat protein [Alicyclobacillus kakegawensis]